MHYKSNEDERVPVGPEFHSQLQPHQQQHPSEQPQRPVVSPDRVLSSGQLCLLASGLTLLVIVNLSLLFWVWTFITSLRIIDGPLYSGDGMKMDVGFDTSFAVGGKRMSVANIHGSPNIRVISPAGISLGPNRRSDSLLKADQTWLEVSSAAGGHSPVSGHITAWTDSFKVVDAQQQRILMNIHEQSNTFGFENVLLKTHRLSLNHSLQTPELRQFNNKLSIISQNRQIRLRAPKSLSLTTRKNEKILTYSTENEEDADSAGQESESSDSSVELSAGNGVFIHAGGRVTISTESVTFGERLLAVHSSKHGRTYPTVGQLCVCAHTGLVYAAAAQMDCVRSGQVCDQNQ